MTKSKKTKEISLLLQQWAFEVGNHLCCDKGFPRKKAFRRAYAVQRCLEALGSGKVRLRYYKKDGTLREAVGTLCKGYSERFDNYEFKDEPGSATSINYDLFLYWDLEEDGYRSFSASRFIGFEVLENSEKYGQLSSRGSK
jgi:hypothetical protein